MRIAGLGGILKRGAEAGVVREGLVIRFTDILVLDPMDWRYAMKARPDHLTDCPHFRRWQDR